MRGLHYGRLRLFEVLVNAPDELSFEGRIEKVGPAVRVQSLWHRSPRREVVDEFLETHWPTDIDGYPLGEDLPDIVVEGIPVEVTVRVPDWFKARLTQAQQQLDDLAAELGNPPPYLSEEEQEDWIEERAVECGDGDLSRELLAFLDSPPPPRQPVRASGKRPRL